MTATYKEKEWKQFINDSTFIGKGGFGDVYGPYVWEDKSCAIKKRLFGTTENCSKAQIACEKWILLQHRNLITVYDVSFESRALYILMEHGKGGSLKSVLERNSAALPAQVLLDWSIQVAQGMEYLHEKGFVHRDLKSENIIIMEPDPDIDPRGKTLRIIDFDQIHEYGHANAMSNVGTVAWMAPEVLNGEFFSKASDVWSYGVVLWEMSTGEVPYKGVKDVTILMGMISGECKLIAPDLCPYIIRTVLDRCLHKDSNERPTFVDILSTLQNPRVVCYERNEQPDVADICSTLPNSQAQRGEVLQEGVTVLKESTTTMRMKSIKLMEADPDQAKGIKPIEPISKPSCQVLREVSIQDQKCMNKSTSGKWGGMVKHLFSKIGGMKTKAPKKREFCPEKKPLTRESIERYREFLEDHIDPDFGLLEKLLADGTLSSREIYEVKDKSPFYKRNCQLLNYISEKSQCNRFIEALRDTEQTHIVNYLNGNRVYCQEYELQWPLTDREISILNANQESLIELLDLSELLGLLCSTKVINKRQRDYISSRPSSSSKNEAFLRIFRMRSLHDYKQTISCLRKSSQGNIADVLESGGVVARVHAHLDGPPENITPLEDEISTAFASVLSGMSPEERSRILKFANLKLIAGKKQHSILLYIWCETIEELSRFYDFLTSGRLKDTVEQLFNQLLSTSQNVAVKTITMNDEDFERIIECFAGNSRMDYIPESPTLEMASSEEYFQFSYINFDEQISAATFIGRGGIGKVYGPCFWKNSLFAFKKISLPCHCDSESQISTERNNRRQQIKENLKALCFLDHHNLIKIWYARFFPPSLYIVMQYAGGGTLAQALQSQPSLFPYSVVINWAEQIATGMSYLHEMSIVHGNLKSGNIMLLESFDPKCIQDTTLKITDFDQFQESYSETTKEIISKASDVWSYGTVLLEILTRQTPCEDQIINYKLANMDSCLHVFIKLFQGCWEQVPEKRPMFSEMLSILHDMHKDKEILDVLRTENNTDNYERVIPTGFFTTCNIGIRDEKQGKVEVNLKITSLPILNPGELPDFEDDEKKSKREVEDEEALTYELLRQLMPIRLRWINDSKECIAPMEFGDLSL